MVANRHLPYEPVLAQVFREVSAIAGDGRFKVLRAARPLVRRP
jgi:16S rRNA (guanine1207-N2)-methyltransferase